MTTEYILQLPGKLYVGAIDVEKWEFATVPDAMLARRFDTATLAHLFAVMLVLPPSYTVEPVEQRQYLFTFHA